MEYDDEDNQIILKMTLLKTAVMMNNDGDYGRNDNNGGDNNLNCEHTNIEEIKVIYQYIQVS